MRTRQLMVGWYESGLESDASPKRHFPLVDREHFLWWSARLAGNTAACPRWPNRSVCSIHVPQDRTALLGFSRACQLWAQNRNRFCRLRHTLITTLPPIHVSSYRSCIELWEPDLSVCADVRSGRHGGGKRSCRTGIWRASLPCGVWCASVGCPFEWMKPHTGYTGTAGHLMDRGCTESRTRDTCWSLAELILKNINTAVFSA